MKLTVTFQKKIRLKTIEFTPVQRGFLTSWLLISLIYFSAAHAQAPAKTDQTIPTLDQTTPSGGTRVTRESTDPNATKSADQAEESTESQTTTPSGSTDSADEQNEDNTNQTQRADAQVGNTEELPFRYLNQYFAYEVNENTQEIKLNDSPFNIREIQPSIADRNFTVVLSKPLADFFKDGQIFFRPKKADLQSKLNEVIEPLTIKDGNRFTITAKRKVNPNNLASVCLTKKSNFSDLTICRSLTQEPVGGKASVTAEGASLGLSGQVILQESQKRSEFHIKWSEATFFALNTERRKVYPATIEKKAQSEKVQIRFVDLVDQTVAWEETITIRQRYVEFKMDPILQVRQDVLFNDADIFNKPISKQLIERAKVTVVAKNRVSFQPQIGVLQLAGETLDLSFKLRSPITTGLLIGYHRYLTNDLNWTFSMASTNAKITLGDSSIPLEGSSVNRLEVITGLDYDLTDRLELQFSLGFKNDLFPSAINVNEGIKIEQGSNDFIETRLQWNAFENDNIEFLFPVKLKIFPPGQSGPVEAKMGTGYEYGGFARAKTKWGRVKAGLTSGGRNQKYEDVSLKEIYYFVTLGVLYLF